MHLIPKLCFLKIAGSLPHGQAHVICFCSAQDKERINMPSSQLNNLPFVISPKEHCAEITQLVIRPSECDGHHLSSFANHQDRVGVKGPSVHTFNWNSVSAKKGDGLRISTGTSGTSNKQMGPLRPS